MPSLHHLKRSSLSVCTESQLSIQTTKLLSDYMSGFEKTRFVGLPDNIAEGLTCSICLSVFNNPVITECFHTFCKRCLQQTIQNGSDACPKCRQRLTPKRSCGTADNDNTIIILRDQRMYVVGRNLAVNDIIGGLQAKCEYDFNGCQELVQMSLLSSHTRQCEHRFCATCGLNVKRDIEHDCIEALKRDRNNWKAKSQEFQRTIDDLKANLSNKSKIINQISRNKQKVINELTAKIEKMDERIKLMTADTKIGIDKLVRHNNRTDDNSTDREDTVEDNEYVLSFPENEVI